MIILMISYNKLIVVTTIVATINAVVFLEVPMDLKIDLSRIEGSPGFLLNQACSQIKLGLLHAFKKNGFNITHEHWSVLRILWDEERLPQSSIAEKTKKDRPNITRIIDVLEKNGYVKRTNDPDDRRMHNVTLTDKGKSSEDILTPLALQFLEDAFAGVTREEYNCFTNVLDKIIQNMNN